MPSWTLGTLPVLFASMAISGACMGQAGDRDIAPVAPAASSDMRGGSPRPYIPPIVVPSAAGQIEPLRQPPPTIRITPPATPSFSSGCDSTGCWGSDGTRYNAVGGSLVRPDGRACQNVGGVISCP